MKSKKSVEMVILAFVIFCIMFFLPVTTNKSYAANMQAGTLSREIDGIDEGIYPGYKKLIKDIQAKHPEYTVLVYYTGKDWNEVLTAEYQGHGTSPLNLFQVGTSYNGMWMCPICGNKAYDNGSWCCASLEALSYMMDPRNSINENDIFQFKDLAGSDTSYADIVRVVTNYGSYINNAEAVQAIVDASSMYGINGYFLVAKILNEHGKNGSTLSNGQGYNGNYVGVYNYFNIGSTGNGAANIINNGLSYAQNAGWTSIRASILGGAALIKQKYMVEYSQNTFYYQKFNVSGLSSMASHQYQQNIMAAQSQGTSMRQYYGTTKVNHTFIIPLYINIPVNTCVRPSLVTQNKITYEEGVIKNVPSSLKVRASANGTIIGALNNGESIKILKRATSQVNGYYWDLIVSNKNGTYGYAARGDSKEQYIVSNGTQATSAGSVGTQEVTPTPEIQTNSNTQPETIDLDKSIKVDNNIVTVLPNVKCEDIKAKYGNVTIKKPDGTEITTGLVGTDYTISAKNEYVIIKKGDIDGDGMITVIDAVLMLNSVKETKVLEGIHNTAACIKNKDTFDVSDAVLLLNYIKGSAIFELK